MKKTLLCVLTTVAVLTSSVSVFAGTTNLKDVYNGAPDTEGVEAQVENLDTKGEISPNTHKTVIITKTHELDGTALTTDVSARTVYVDQSASVYSSALTVMFANDLEPGYYTATMGTVTDTSYEAVNFVVGNFEVDPDNKLTVLDEAEAYGQGTLAGTSTTTWYKKSFTKTVSYDEYYSFNSLILVSADGTEYLGAIPLHKDYTTSLNTHGFAWDRTKLTGTGDVTVALQIYAIPEAQTGFSLYFSTDEVAVQ